MSLNIEAMSEPSLFTDLPPHDLPTQAHEPELRSEPTMDAVASDHLVMPEQAEKHLLSLEFTGNGSEYFKIWITNLCLTILSFGVYSAWAKVRRLQYFDRNTRLDGVPFDFHGSPITILRGRIVAVIALFAYHYLFGLSIYFALSIAAIIFALAPWMMRSSQRFRLRHTSYRGLRFDFQGDLLDAYATYLPVVLMFLVPPLLTVIVRDNSIVALSSALYLAWPWLQARMKQYQHGGIAYGGMHSNSSLSASDFVWFYFKSGVFVFLSLVFAGILAVAMYQLVPMTILVYVVAFSIATYLMYVALGPYVQVKIWNKSWETTRLGEIEIYSALPAGAFTKLQTKNLLLTLLSLGLYRPFAVVSVYRFRLAHMTLRADPAVLLRASGSKVGESAEGEGVAEFLGFDLSW